MNTKELIIYFEKKYNKKINKFNDTKWYEISEFQYLTEEFIEKYENKVDWIWISAYQKLSEKFIEKYKNEVDWHLISYYQKLSGEFINKYKEKINFKHISKENKINYLKYQVKYNIISNSDYLKEILKIIH